MKYWIFAAVLWGLCGLNAISGHAAETVNGRWAVDPAVCWGGGSTPAQSAFVVSSHAVRWLGDTCRVGRMYKTGETIHLQAFCWSADGERTIPVSMTPRAGRLAVIWDRNLRGVLRRCD